MIFNKPRSPISHLRRMSQPLRQHKSEWLAWRWDKRDNRPPRWWLWPHFLTLKQYHGTHLTRWCPSSESLSWFIYNSPNYGLMADITIVFMGFINQQTSLGGIALYVIWVQWPSIFHRLWKCCAKLIGNTAKSCRCADGTFEQNRRPIPQHSTTFQDSKGSKMFQTLII